MKSVRVGVDSDDECIMSYERVSLRDPHALAKMTIPGRSQRCLHLQCFDLQIHIEEAYRQRGKRAWLGGPGRGTGGAYCDDRHVLVTCPISACAVEISVTELVKDAYFQGILQRLKVSSHLISCRHHPRASKELCRASLLWLHTIAPHECLNLPSTLDYGGC